MRAPVAGQALLRLSADYINNVFGVPPSGGFSVASIERTWLRAALQTFGSDVQQPVRLLVEHIISNLTASLCTFKGGQ